MPARMSGILNIIGVVILVTEYLAIHFAGIAFCALRKRIQGNKTLT